MNIKKLSKFALALALLVCPLADRAQGALNYYFSGIGTGATTNSYVLVSGQYGTPRCQFLYATSDAATSNLTFYASSPAVYAGAPSTNATKTVNVAGIGNFNVNDVIVILNSTNAVWSGERCIVASTNATNITVQYNLVGDYASNAPIYKQTVAGTVLVGTNALTINAQGGAFFNGQSRKPLLVETGGASTCKLNLLSGVYDVNTP